MSDMADSSVLVGRVRDGDRQALGELLEAYRDRLQRVVQFRMDRRLYGRIDPADVLQEAYLEATTRLQEYFHNPKAPFFLWLRFITVQKLVAMHRFHLGAQARDAGREVSLYGASQPGATSVQLAAQLLGAHTSPSQAVAREEVRAKLEEALNTIEEMDREVLALRHFEQLSNNETAEVLGITVSAASNRYVRAVKRLAVILERTSELGQSDCV